MSADLVAELIELCRGRDLSAPARADLARVMASGTDDEQGEVIAHLRHIPIVRTEDVDVCAETTARFVERWAQLEARVAAHRDRLGGAAYRLGFEVGRYAMTLDDAYAQLARLADRPDLEVADLVRMRLVPYDEGRAIIRDAFGRGMRAAERRAAG